MADGPATDDVADMLASTVRAFNGSWAAYVLTDAVLLHDFRSDKFVQVTPAFLSWLLNGNIEPGRSPAAMLGIDAA